MKKDVKGRKNWIYLLAILIAVLALYFIAQTIKDSLSQKYYNRGEEKLLQEKYISAIVEYQKSDYLKKSAETENRIELAREAEKDIKRLEAFLREKNATLKLNDLKQAEAVPTDAYTAVINARSFLEKKKPQLAVISATTATEMKKEYRDAWLYLGIAHLDVFNQVELSAENKEWHKSEAKKALEKAKTLDITYQPTIDLLDQCNKL